MCRCCVAKCIWWHFTPPRMTSLPFTALTGDLQLDCYIAEVMVVLFYFIFNSELICLCDNVIMYHPASCGAFMTERERGIGTMPSLSHH